MNTSSKNDAVALLRTLGAEQMPQPGGTLLAGSTSPRSPQPATPA
ncbi:hypothetical protein ACIPY6_44010 [Streptomyces sp. NPDC090054]